MRRELLYHAFRDEAVLDDITLEHVQDGTEEGGFIASLLDVMMEMKGKGVTPTPENVAASDPQDSAGLLREIREMIDLSNPPLGAPYIVAHLREEYSSRVLGEIAIAISTGRAEGAPSSDISDRVAELQRKLPSTLKSVGAKKATARFMEHIKAIWTGQVPARWKTGLTKLDSAIKWDKQRIILVPAVQKAGKSRVITALVMKLIEHQPNLKVIWFNLEMGEEEMSLLCCSVITGIRTDIIDGSRRMPTQHEQEMILRARTVLQNLPISYYGAKTPMREMRRVIAKHADENTVVVIDNLGLIKGEPGRTETQHDDYVAGELVDLRDTYKPMIIALHHLSKESTSHFNKATFFEPEIRHIRGSARLADYANVICILHRVEMYEDQLRGAVIPEDKWKSDIAGRILFKARSRDSGDSRIIVNHDLTACQLSE